MLNDLLLLSGNDIPFPQAQVTIHQPTIKEIAYIGEEAFFIGCELLNFSKNILTEEDKFNLGDKTNFDILIAILREQNAVMQKNRNCVLMVLALMFPDYEIIIKDSIILKKEDTEYKIDSSNFEEFKIILNKMFDTKKEESSSDFNPSGDLAKKIADKLKKRHQRLAEKNNQKTQKIDILSRYISILAIAQNIDMNSLLNYTVYQLYDTFKRYELKSGYDIYVKAKMAGAKDLKEVEDWMQDIHS